VNDCIYEIYIPVLKRSGLGSSNKRDIIIRVGATTEFGLTVAGSTGWFPDYLPIAGSHAVEAVVVIGTAALLHEVVEFAREIARKLCAWRRRTRPPRPAWCCSRRGKRVQPQMHADARGMGHGTPHRRGLPDRVG
jgi:hypothetical protein